MKLFVSISSCFKFEDNGWNDAVRNTWLKDAKSLGIDYKFFFGKPYDGMPSVVPEDATVIDAGDDYGSLFYKTIAKHEWAYNNREWDYIFHCYHDTYACPERLLKLLGKADYIGDYYHQDPRQPWAHESCGMSCQSGGGVLISRKAMKYLLRELPRAIKCLPNMTEEDWWTGIIIQRLPEFQGIKLRDLSEENESLTIMDHRGFPSNLTPDDPGPRQDNNIVTSHLSTIQPSGKWDKQGREAEWKYRPEFMYKLHEEWKNPCQHIVEEPSISCIPDTSDSSNGPKRTSRK